MDSGGASLATARFLRQKMLDQHIHCRFALGGITGQITAMHEEGLIDRVHPDTAEGASLSVVVAPLTRGRIPTIVKHVNTVVTPGEVVDVVVTEQGIAVNPRRPDLKEKIEAAGLHVFTIEQLQQRAEALVGVPEPIRYKDRIVGVVMYRDNTIIDVVHEIDEDA